MKISFINKVKKIIITSVILGIIFMSNVSMADNTSYQATGDVYRRSQPNVFGKATGVLKKGTAINGSKLENGWIEYTVDDIKYYSSGKYLKNTTEVEKEQQNKSASVKNDKKFSYSRVLTVKATAYSMNEVGLSHMTASGIDLRKNPNVIAVDRLIIPLGTKVYVEGYGYAIAGDTGGAIKGNKIDVHFNSVSRCYQWGVKNNVKVYILD